MSTTEQSEADEIRANAAITKFLDYYVDPSRPFDYAVMVNGPWGSGKTHLVKEFLRGKSSLKSLYVTLNGISSVDQIDQQFYRQLHPVLSSRGMGIAVAIGRAVAKGAFKLDFTKEESGTLNLSMPEIDLTKDLDDPRDRLLIFDDLERCKMPISEVLGYINGFVEHDGLKAIILANEKEIRAHTDLRYDEIREKLIGQTLTVSAPAGEAFDVFASQVSDERTKAFLKRHRENVLALHTQGGRGNLRTLKHAMWDFEKIGSQLEERHWRKEESVLKIMKGAMVITMEYRAGDLNEGDLSSLVGNRVGRLMRRTNGGDKSKADVIDERYPQVDFDKVLLGAPMLGAILLRGEIDAPGLVAALDATRDYAKPAERPLWLQAMDAFTYDDTTCERIASEVEIAFANRQFTVRGEFLLIAGIRLWFANIGLLSKTLGDIVADSKTCIDDLARDSQLETSLDGPKGSIRDIVYRGYAPPESGTSEHREIVAYYDKMSGEQEERQYPQIAQELLAQLSIDPDGFLFDLVRNTVRDGRYWDRPVLASLPPQQFARTVFEASPELQSRAIEALLLRHQYVPSTQLMPERPWIAQVKAELEKLMTAAKPMTRYRLQVLIARNFDPLVASDGAAAVAGSTAIE